MAREECLELTQREQAATLTLNLTLTLTLTLTLPLTLTLTLTLDLSGHPSKGQSVQDRWD